MGHLSGAIVAGAADDVEHSQRSKAHRSIKFGSSEMLKYVDYNLVSGVTSRKPGDSHQRRYLPNSNVNCGACHERGYCCQGDKFDNPSEAGKAKEANDGTRDHGECGCNDMTWYLRVTCFRREHNVAGDCRRYCHGLQNISLEPVISLGADTDSDRDVFGRCEKPVDQDTHERRVEPKLWWKLSQKSICHSLGNHDGANSNTYRFQH